MNKHFHALGVGRVFTGGHHRAVQRVRLQVSMPSVSGGRLQHPPPTPARGPSTSFYALGGGRAFTVVPGPERCHPVEVVSMPSVSGGRLQGSSYLCHLSWADGVTCERLADGRLPETGFGLVKVRKWSLTCVRALPGFGGTTVALAAT